MDRQAAYVQHLRKAYPALDIASVTFNAQGQNSDVLVINDAWIFRFPRYAPGLERLRIETAILNGIQGRVPLAVPHPRFVHLTGCGVGEAFVGYRLIPGQPLWRDTFRALSTTAVRRVADQVASFLQALHRVPVEAAIGLPLPVSDTHQEIAGIYARIREKLFDMMRPDARRWAATHFETFLSDAGHFAYTPVLKHGDFGTSNILFDQEKGEVTGIIDFGGAGMGDPAYDLAGLLSSYGEAFVRSCAGVYPAVAGYMDRVRFYRGTFALLEALFGVENEDEVALKAGLAQYV